MVIAQFTPFKTLCPTVIKKLLPFLLGGLFSIGFLLLWQQLTLNPQIHQIQSFFPIIIIIGGLILVWLLVLIAYLIQVSDRQKQQIQQLQWEINQQQQAESEAKYQQLIDNLNAGFVIHAADSSILFCNSIACALLGLSMDQMLGKTVIDSAWHFIHEDGTVMPIEKYPVNLVLSTGIPIKNHVLGINTGISALVWVLVNAYPEFDDNHQLKQVVITFIDISKRKQAEEETQQTHNFLQTLLDHLPVAVFVKDGCPEKFGVLSIFLSRLTNYFIGIGCAKFRRSITLLSPFGLRSS